MRFTVTWKPSAEQELARIWISAADRQAVRKAADALEMHLKKDPLSVGESRSGKLRIAFYKPLAFHFQVLEDDVLVQVLEVWRTA